jgi:ATP-dependent Clp protease ATP-binding subunit ClpX
MIQINTQNILFICGGAFDGIEKKIAKRLQANVVGYGVKDREEVDKDNLIKYVAPQDLKSYGLIPELVGRLPVVTYLHSLDRDILHRILLEPKNSLIKQYTRLFEMDKIKLTFDEDVYAFVVDKAIEFKLGARGLRSILEAIMMDAMYDLPSQSKQTEINITVPYAEDKLRKTNIERLKVA